LGDVGDRAGAGTFAEFSSLAALGAGKLGLLVRASEPFEVERGDRIVSG
jgi:hypothetical protein